MLQKIEERNERSYVNVGAGGREYGGGGGIIEIVNRLITIFIVILLRMAMHLVAL